LVLHLGPKTDYLPVFVTMGTVADTAQITITR